MSSVVPQMPPRVPKGGNAFTRWLGGALLRLLGWRVTGGLPDERRFIVIAAPHTSNWDWAIAMVAMFALGLRINYMVKDSAFVWPVSVFLRATGGLPTNRAAPTGLVEDLAARVLHTPEIILVITPEGTRARVERWKTGFLRIAELAHLPVVQVSWDYPSRTITLGPLAELTGDHEADVARIRAYYRQFTGRNPENQSP
jgi:1-acyl-sn-glycerol-3-phosphate acyltransferase